MDDTTRRELAERDRLAQIQQRLDEAAGLWTPFVFTIETVQRATGAVQDITKEGWLGCWANNRYTVLGRRDDKSGVTWLSIRREDRQPIRSWRDLQRIKNEIISPDAEAFELFPAETRLVDTSNQYHLWVLPVGERIGVGFKERLVLDVNDVDPVLGSAPGGHVQHAMVEALPYLQQRFEYWKKEATVAVSPMYRDGCAAVIVELKKIITTLGGSI